MLVDDGDPGNRAPGEVAGGAISRLVSAQIRWRTWILAAALALGCAASYRTALTYLDLRSDLEQLLPATAPSVRALEVLRGRLPGMQHLGVVVDAGGRANLDAAVRFLDDLAERVRGYPPRLVSAVRVGAARERRFFETYALQLMEPADVRRLADAVEARHEWEVGQVAGLDLLDEGAPPPIPWEELRRKYEDRFGPAPELPGDRFVSRDGRTAVLVIQTGAESTGIDLALELVRRVRADAEALGFPGRYAPGMRLGMADDVASRVEELQGLIADLTVSGLLVLVLVLGSIVWYFRSWRALPILGLPLAAGTVAAFGIVALPPLSIRHLNSNTAFLGSIVVGNGINCGIMLLARYREERRSRDVEAAIVHAVRETWRPTLAAAAAASAAYGSLVATDFRGFNQFGWIGGIGLLGCWVATYLLAPPLIAVFGRRLRLGGRPRTLSWSRFLGLVRHRRVLAAGSLLLCAASIAGIVGRSGDWLETDSSRLRRRDSWTRGERYWGRLMDATLQANLTPTVVLARDGDEAGRIAGRVRELASRGGGGGFIASVRTGDMLLPPWRRESLAEAPRLRRHLTPAVLGGLDPEERRLVELALSPEAMRPLEAGDLPESLTLGVREHDGRLDRNVVIANEVTEATWTLEPVRRFAREIRGAAGDAPAAGSLLLSNDILETMLADGPKATAIALAAVLLIALFSFRSLRLSLAAVLSLLVGVLLMLGAMAWGGQRVNFCNFVTLPITFGIAADYAVNMLKRFQADGGDWSLALGHTSGAVALCSATTILGFGSLLAAQSQALFSFGVFAVAGEVTCLVTATLLLPALLRPRVAAGAPPVRR